MGGVKDGAPDRVLCVDLDGTLLRSDLLHESLCSLVKRSPLTLFSAMLWLFQGKAAFKRNVAQRVSLDVASLPYNAELLSFLRAERERGRSIVLATASDRLQVEPIAEHLGIFSAVVASDGVANLSGAAKCEALQAQCAGGFDYIGNSWVDVPIWNHAGQSYVVTNDKKLIAHLETNAKVERVFSGTRGSIAKILKVIRVHQWVKNLLLFVPAIMAHEIGNGAVLSRVLLGFAAFCLCSSSVYVTNDLLDLEADRVHASKRKRPLAAGEVSLVLGMLLIPILLLGSAALASFLPLEFLGVLGVYFLTTLLYSFYLKQVVLIDIFVLAGLYTLRILAGGQAALVPVSTWLLAFSMFIFLSLASLKRFSELYRLRLGNGSSAKGRGYLAGDLELVSQMGVASGFISALVLALYINSGQVVQLYSNGRVLWLLCPLIMYWIGRMWLLAHRGEVHEDPIVFALKDSTSYLIGALSAILLLLAV